MSAPTDHVQAVSGVSARTPADARPSSSRPSGAPADPPLVPTPLTDPALTETSRRGTRILDKNSKRSKLYIAVGLIIALIVGGGGLHRPALLGRRATRPGRDAQRRRRRSRHRQSQAHRGWRRRDAHRSRRRDKRAAFTRIDDVLGRISGVTISSGELVTSNLLASNTSAARRSRSWTLVRSTTLTGPDSRAVSVTVPDDRAVAGTLQAGQRVDLIVTMALNPELGQPAGQAAQTQAKFVPGPSTKVTLQSMTILARNGTIYILRADLTTAEKIAELPAAGGQFTMALRPDEDDRVAKTSGRRSTASSTSSGSPIRRRHGRAPARRHPERRSEATTSRDAGPWPAPASSAGQQGREAASPAVRVSSSGRRSVDHHVGGGDLHRLRRLVRDPSRASASLR